MPQTAREYLIHRFRGDAHALNERVAAMQRGTKLPGPDATTSRKMAEACDTVAAMLESVAPHEDRTRELERIVSLVPLLEQRARDMSTLPPVRAVYTGAATRIREVQTAEASAAVLATDAITGVDDVNDVELDEDIDGGMDDDIDEDIDDDDLHDGDEQDDGRHDDIDGPRSGGARL